jgi:hypothetical protein
MSRELTPDRYFAYPAHKAGATTADQLQEAELLPREKSSLINRNEKARRLVTS